MFQPVNESYVRAVAEASVERHVYETEEERAARQCQVYQPGDSLRWVRGPQNTFGQALLAIASMLFGTTRQFGTLPRRRPILG